MRDKQRRLSLRGLQAVVTISLMAWLLNQIELSSLLPLVADLRWGFVALGIGFLLLAHLVNVVRWQYLLQHPGVNYGKLLRSYGVGLFGNNFLPTGFGGDSVRVVTLSQVVAVSRSLVSVGLDRVIGFIALSALLAIGLWFGPPPNLSNAISGLVPVFAEWKSLLLAVIFMTALGLLSLAVWCRLPSLRGTLSSAFTQIAGTVDQSQWTIERWLRILAGGYAFSVLSHLCMVAATWVLLQAVGIGTTFAASIWLVLAGALSLLLPVSINGLGVQEAVFVTVLSAYDVPSTPTLLAALLGRLVQVLFALAGGLGWLLTARPVETANGSSSE